jgi:glycerophosphoryl diester phosphodiesterase
MIDRKTFLRPFAHRGLHHAAAGIIENTEAAFMAAIAKSYGIECDLRPAGDGLPVVFHDETLDRLTESSGPVSRFDAKDLARVSFKGAKGRILTFAEFLELGQGRVPLLVEIKSEWDPPDPRYLRHISDLAIRYRGPLAFMSFDPAIMAALAQLAPGVARGIVSGMYRSNDPEGWWDDRLSPERQEGLSHLLESRQADPHFYAYHVKALPTPVTRFVREVLGLPLFAWTVRSEEERRIAARWADAPIFEGFEP